MVYDCTDQKSFDTINYWMKSLDENAPKNVVRILVGNKCDQDEIKVISTETGQELADKYKIPFFETSAKSGHNVNELFD